MSELNRPTYTWVFFSSKYRGTTFTVSRIADTEPQIWKITIGTEKPRIQSTDIL